MIYYWVNPAYSDPAKRLQTLRQWVCDNNLSYEQAWLLLRPKYNCTLSLFRRVISGEVEGSMAFYSGLSKILRNKMVITKCTNRSEYAKKSAMAKAPNERRSDSIDWVIRNLMMYGNVAVTKQMLKDGLIDRLSQMGIYVAVRKGLYSGRPILERTPQAEQSNAVDT